MADIDLDELERLAKAATPGEWRVVEDVDAHNDPTGLHQIWEAWRPIKSLDGSDLQTSMYLARTCYAPQSEANAVYIAAANPQAVLALIERVRRAEGALRPERDEYEGDPAESVIYPPLRGDIGRGPTWR